MVDSSVNKYQFTEMSWGQKKPSPGGEGGAVSAATDEVEILESNEQPQIKKNAQKLRREMTKEERRLWYDFLKRLPITVNRQKVIGPYIVDFYCASRKLVIELDGSQHYEDEGAASDRGRDHALNQLGITVVRYSNDDINRNFDGVCADLLRRLELPGIEEA